MSSNWPHFHTAPGPKMDAELERQLSRAKLAGDVLKKAQEIAASRYIIHCLRHESRRWPTGSQGERTRFRSMAPITDPKMAAINRWMKQLLGSFTQVRARCHHSSISRRKCIPAKPIREYLWFHTHRTKTFSNIIDRSMAHQIQVSLI